MVCKDSYPLLLGIAIKSLKRLAIGLNLVTRSLLKLDDALAKATKSAAGLTGGIYSDYLNRSGFSAAAFNRSLKNNLMRSFSQINAPPSSAGGAPLYWKNEKKLHIQKVKREINYYIKDPVLEFNNKTDFIKRENPKISLVIPIYNKEKFLIPLYKSIQNQSLKDIEIIFIDDNSSDNSVKVIEEFMQEDKRIILIKHDTNYKTFYSRNEGVGVAKAKYILFIDPDDLILNDILEKCYETAEKNNLEHSVSYYEKKYLQNDKYFVYPDSIPIIYRNYNQEENVIPEGKKDKRIKV